MSSASTFWGDWLGSAPVEYKFYGGTVSVVYDDEVHSYVRYEGDAEVRIPGVTSVTGIVDKSEALMAWSANLASDYVAQQLEEWLKSDKTFADLTKETVDGWCNKARRSHKYQKDRAADIGHVAHSWIEDFIRMTMRRDWGALLRHTHALPENPFAANGCMAALSWMSTHRVRWLLTERKIYSANNDYAGTLDGLAFVSSCGDSECCGAWVNDNGRWELVAQEFHDALAIVDWKTTSSIRPQYAWQTAAYLSALQEEVGHDSPYAEFQKPITHRFIARLGKEDAKFESRLLMPWTVEQDFTTFLQCLALYRSVSSTEEEDKQLRKEIRVQRRQDREDAEAAEKAAKAAARESKREIKDFRATRYKELRASRVPVAEAKEQVEREAKELYG